MCRRVDKCREDPGLLIATEALGEGVSILLDVGAAVGSSLV